MKNRFVAAAAAAILILAACSGGGEAAVPGDPEAGRDLYENGVEGITNTCLHCHSLDGSEITGMLAGPSLQGISDVAGERVEGQSAEEYLRESILNPGAYLVEGYNNNMEPSYRFVLSDEQVDDLIAFLLTQ